MKAFIDTAFMRDFVCQFSYKIIDKIFGLSDLKVDLFTFAAKVELESGSGLVVFEVAGLDSAEACSSCSDEVVLGFLRYRHEYGVFHVDFLFADYKVNGKSVILKCVTDRNRSQYQQENSDDYKCCSYC